MRMPSRKQLAMIFAAVLVVAGVSLPYALHADDGFATDGYLSWDDDSDCLLMKEHDGKVRVLTGAIDGLDEDDHVRVWGRALRGGAECNDYDGPAYEVTEVLTVWANDRHSETYYDHETDGSFQRWARRNRGE
jgi:hypothetical protein